MLRPVKGDGRKSARLVLIGEAPGHHEVAQGRPFVGPSGHLLARWWREAGLQRSDFFIDNVYPFQAKANKIETVPKDELASWTESLHQRLAELDDPWLIIPTGNTALRALTGKSGITKHRGSLYEYTDQRGRTVKVIPTIHPAAIFRQPGWERRCRHDWTRIASDREFRELRLPQREHFIKPTLSDCADFLEDARARAEILAFDIETPRQLLVEEYQTKKGATRYRNRFGPRRIVCIGFAFESHFSITIPTTLSYWRDEGSLAEAWDIIHQLCQLPCPKAGQNAATFDCWWLRQPEYNIRIRNFQYDTRWMHHAVNANDSHDLGYQASIETREPYWKDDNKESNEDDSFDVAAERDVDTFWRYNGKDNCVTRELVDIHLERLKALGRLDFYDQHYRQLFPAMLDMMLEGLPVDQIRRKRRFSRLTADCLRIQDKLAALAGESLFGKKDLSSKRLMKFLYETLKLPRQYKTATTDAGKERRVTANEVAVRKLMIRFPDKLTDSGQLILDHRRKKKLSEFLSAGRVDDDGRIRSSFAFVETLRFSSSKDPRKGGANLQNQDREVRDIFIPLPGMFFLEVDESQAEDRIVKMLAAAVTKDPVRREILLTRARAKPWENDEHKRAAAIIFHHDQAAAKAPLFLGDGRITKDERYLGKRVRHAGNYGMRGLKLSEELLKEGVVIGPDEGDHMIDTLLVKDTPEVRDWQRAVRQTVLRERCIANSWGHLLDVTYERLNDDLYRRCYAFQPQSEVPMLVNQWGFLPLRAMIRANRLKTRIHLQGHDSLLMSTTIEEAYDIASFLADSLQRARRYAGEPLIIPCEFKAGLTWAGGLDFKRLPDRDEFNAAIRDLLTQANAA